MSRPSVRDSINATIHAGRVPRLTQGNRVIIRTGDAPSSYLVLVKTNGAVTPAGEAYHEISGAPWAHVHVPGSSSQRRLDLNQEPVRLQDSEYARDSHNHLVRLRTLNPRGAFTYTAQGRLFFSRRQVEYIVSIPVLIKGIRKNGRPYERKDHLPVTNVGLGRILVSALHTQPLREARVRSLVLNGLGIRTQGGMTVVLEVSGETYFYDRQGQWLISELITTPHEGGDPHVETIMNRPMGALRSNAAFIPHCDEVLDEAWVERGDRLCVPRQLAILFGRPCEEIAEEFDAALQGDEWRHSGLTPLNIKQWCVENHFPFFCVAPSRGLIDSFTPLHNKGRAVAFCCYDGHAYFYKSARVVSLWRGSTPTPVEGEEDAREEEEAQPARVRTALQGDRKETLPPWSEWQEWTLDMAPRPGFFYTEDLMAVRRQLLVQGINPRVTLRSLGLYSALKVRCVLPRNGAKGDCVIREIPDNASIIRTWCENLNVEWRGERLPAASLRVLYSLMKASRERPSDAEKAKVLGEQRGMCAACGALMEGGTEWDHVGPLRQVVRGARQTFRALCVACHLEATQLEGGSFTLESRFSKRAYDYYVQSPRPPPLVWQPNSPSVYVEGEVEERGEPRVPEAQAPCVEWDVRRCRQNALRHSSHEFSVFCPQDSLKPSVSGSIGDFSFVTMSDKRRSKLNTLPFTGDGWYHRVAVEFGLHHGKIRWEDITWSFTSTGRLSRDVFEEPLAAMEAAWGEDLEENAKLSVNSLIGLWATDTNEMLSVKSSRDPNEGAGCWARSHFEYGEGASVVDSVFLTKLLTNASMRPIHDQIMHTEATRVAQMIYVVTSLGVPQRCITDVKTDAVLMRDFPRKARRILEEVVETITFETLPYLRRLYPTPMAGQNFLDQNGGVPQGREGDGAQVFKFGSTATRLQGHREEPGRDAAPVIPLKPYRDLTEEEAMALMVQGGSLMVQGAPGTGKTHWARERVKEMRALKCDVAVVAKTHAACMNFGEMCQTCDHFVRRTVRQGRCIYRMIVVEEFTQVSTYLWADLVKPLMRGTSFLLVGDVAQLGPVKDTWCGQEAPCVENSDLLHELCGGLCFTLTENKRSDPPLFDFYVGLRTGTPTERPLDEALYNARSQFPLRDGYPRFTLCMSHATRLKVNAEANLREKPEDAVLFEAQGARGYQDLWLYPGCVVIGGGGGKVYKGLFYTVTQVDPTSVLVQGALGQSVRLSGEQAVKSLRLSHAITYAGCQGLTLEGRVRLLDTDSTHFTGRHLYVGSSRATAAHLLEVA